MSDKIDELKKNSVEILKAETAALLFNLGKTHFGFWKKRIKDDPGLNIDENNYKKDFGYDIFSNYNHYFKKGYNNKINNDDKKNKVKECYEIDMTINIIKESKNKDLNNIKDDKLLKFINDTDINIVENKIEFIEIMKGKASDKDFVQKVFFRGCENINSGIDKGNPDDDQKLKTMWLSNAFGSFKEKVIYDNLDPKRKLFFENLFHFLNKNDYFTNSSWKKIKKIRNFVFKEIKEWYSHLLSDSRYPINDVSLWDQAYMTSTMFKSAIAAIALDNNKYNSYIQNPQKIRWCILGVQYDKKSLYEKALKCSYVQAYKEIINKIDEKVKNLIELTYALGNEIYRDETGIYFLAPENIKGEKIETDSSFKFYNINNDLYLLEKEINEIFKKESNSEIFPCILCTEDSRGLLTLSGLLERSRDNFLNKKIFSLPKVNKNNNICQVCGVRIAEKYDLDYHVCKECFNRREKRLENWFDNLSKETIWTGELQDNNGKIALITLKFDLGLWLNGEMMSSLKINKDVQVNGYQDIKYFIKNMFCNRIIFNDEITNLIQKQGDEFKRLKSLEGDREYKKNTSICSSELRKLEKSVKEFNKISMMLYLYRGQENINESNNEKLIKCDDLKKEIYFNSFDGSHLPTKIKEHIQNIKDKLSKLEGKIPQNDDLNSLYITLNYIDEKMNLVDKLQKKKEWLFGYIHDNETKKVVGIAYDAFKGCCNRKETLMDLFRQIFINPAADKGWIKLFNSEKEIINVSTGEIKFDQMTDEQLELFSKLLFQLLITKSPSPARLKRIWDSTQNFMEEINKNAYEFLDLNQEKYRSYRLIFRVDKNYPEGLYKYKELDFYYKRGNIILITSLSKAKKLIFNNDNEKVIINENIDIDNLKPYLKPITIEKVDGKSNKITLKPDYLIEVCKYKPIFTITSPSPVSTQIIIPADKVDVFIEKVQETYMEKFKWVNGKLPLHIGVVVQNYKMPLYIGIKALRKMERQFEKPEDIEKTELLLDKKEMMDFFNESKKLEKDEENSNDIYKFYSLYKTNDNEGFEFFYLNKEAKFSLPPNPDSLKEIKYTIYPNTIDFEYIDTNTRINDIYYDDKNKFKRYLKLKSNRPYTWNEWRRFKLFKEIFDDNLKTKLNNLISTLYSKLYDWQVVEGKNYDQFKKFCASLFYNTLELKNNNEIIYKLYKIFDIDKKDYSKNNFINNIIQLENDKFIKNIFMFLDMYEFWHKALREV